MQKKKTLGKVERTNRGFEIIRFSDRHGTECSLQESSLAEYAKPGTSAIWLGPSKPDPKMLHGYATAHGVHDPGAGWIPYPMPEYVQCTTRAHLDREQVAALIEHLRAWLKHDTFNISGRAPSRKRIL